MYEIDETVLWIKLDSSFPVPRLDLGRHTNYYHYHALHILASNH